MDAECVRAPRLSFRLIILFYNVTVSLSRKIHPCCWFVDSYLHYFLCVWIFVAFILIFYSQMCQIVYLTHLNGFNCLEVPSRVNTRSRRICFLATLSLDRKLHSPLFRQPQRCGQHTHTCTDTPLCLMSPYAIPLHPTPTLSVVRMQSPFINSN